MPTTYEPIQSYTVTSTQTSVTLSSIPQTYTDLVLVLSIVSGGTGQDYYLRFNNDTSGNYYREITRATDSFGGSAASSAWAAGNTQLQMGFNVVGINTGQTGFIEYHISRYADTTINKTCLFRAGSPNSGNREIAYGNAIWTNSTAISSIVIAGSSSFSVSDIAIGTKISLYGIKEA